MADRIVIMRDGHIQQIGTPTEVYGKPGNTFVARFIGSPSMNLLSGTIGAGGIDLDGIGRTLLPMTAGLTDGLRVMLGARPDDLRLVPPRPEGLNLKGVVAVVEPLGPDTLVYLDVAGQQVVTKAEARRELRVGETVEVAAAAGDLHFFDETTGRAIRQ